jgi:general secretion pathway protein F/type IV pilus assembly protein PilC
MPDFQYIARELSGRQVTGVLTAANEHDALGTLAAKSLFPVNLSLAQGAKTEAQLTRGRVRARHLAVFYTQLADLLKSGVPLLRSLELLERQTSQSTLKQVIQNVKEHVADGTRLAEAMRHHPRVFGDLQSPRGRSDGLSDVPPGDGRGDCVCDAHVLRAEVRPDL